MTPEEFETVFSRQFEQSSEVLLQKAKEYAGDGDRLHNFKVASAFQGNTCEQALLGMLTKHLVSISDMVRSGKSFPTTVWDEKIGDAINYLILLRAQAFETENQHTAVYTHESTTPVAIIKEYDVQ